LLTYRAINNANSLTSATQGGTQQHYIQKGKIHW